MKLNFALLFLLILSAFTTNAQLKTMTYAQLEKRTSQPDTVYIVNFWATWCAPCVAELPGFDKLKQTYKNAPLKILLMSMDSKSKLQSTVIPFLKKHKIQVEVYFAEREDDQEYINQVDKNWSGALPGTLVINNKKGIHKFYEQAFTYEELNKIYQTNK